MNRFPARRTWLALACALALSAACYSPKHSLGLPREQIARVHGREMSTFKLLGLDGYVVFTSIDGKPLETSKMGSYPKQVEVLPGHRQIGISYSYRIDGQPGPSGDATVELDALGGRSYRIREEFTSGTPSFRFEEVDATAE